MLGSRPVVQPGDEVSNPRCIRFLGTAPPPGRDLGLGLIPGSAKGGQIPFQRWNRRIGRSRVQVGLDLRQRPVLGEPAGTKMLSNHGPLGRSSHLHLEPPAARPTPRESGTSAERPSDASVAEAGKRFSGRSRRRDSCGNHRTQVRQAKSLDPPVGGASSLVHGREGPQWTTCCRSGASRARPGCR